MTLTLHAHLLLLAFTPLTLFAQINAGDQTGVLYTTVGVVLHPSFEMPPYESLDTASVDLDGDGVFDLRFSSSRRSYADASSNSNGVGMLHAGMEVVVEAPGSYVAQRLNAGDAIDTSLPWRSFDTPGVIMGAIGSTIAGPYTTGGNEWLANGLVDTEGYLGVRIVDDAGTRYGWVGLTSYIYYDSLRIDIVDMAIQDASTGVDDAPALERITARLMPDGNVLFQGPVGYVERITVHDASGRMVRQIAGPAPYAIDLSGEAHGVYILRLHERAGLRTLKVVW